MDSSPDLSLKLRRGSSDSRDNFYMDFAQGIDSDIEEVDNSAIARSPQQPPTPPEAPGAEHSQIAAIVLPPPLPMHGQPLPTLSETDDLPPTPPPDVRRTTISSPPVSPASVLEMVPPPPFSPSMELARRASPAPSPPIETEDEGDDGDVEEPTDVDEDDDDDDDEKATPPPPLPPLPSNFSYIQDYSAHAAFPAGPESPSITKSPSTSPSPPMTPPRCPKLSSSKVTSPPPPLTPPSESDHSQSNSPPLLPQKVIEDLTDAAPTTPPPEFGEANDMVAAVLAAAAEATTSDLAYGIPPDASLPMTEENKSFDDESTTITTPPSNGYSASSIIAPPTEHLGELEHDRGFMLADIPPPAGMEDDGDEKEDGEEEGEDKNEDKTPASEAQPDDVATEEQTTEDIQQDEDGDGAGTQTPTASGSLKRSGSIASGGSRGPSRSGSRSGSRKASRSGSVRSGVGSRAGSIAAASVASVAGSIASGSQPIAALSPQASIKSIRSTPSVKSTLSKHSATPSQKRSPPPVARSQSPPEGDSAPVMSSPPMMRSPPQQKTPPIMHSPPKVTSPPRVYSPPLVSSPPQHKSDADKSTDKTVPTKSTGPDPLPSTSLSAAAGAAAVAATSSTGGARATATVAFQDEYVVKPHLSSHHHYHLPHQFQHPHHQNHHTHMHGSVPVATPTVPASYMGTHLFQESRHVRASSGGGDDESSCALRSPSAHNGPSPNTPLPSETGSHASVSPSKSSSRMRDSTSHHRVTIDESNLPLSASLTQQALGGTGSSRGIVGGSGSGDGDGSNPPSPGSSSHQQLANLGDDRQTGHLALMYHSHQLTNFPVLPAIKRTHRPSFIYPPMPRVKAGDALATLFSALYGKLLVVMGIAFPMAEVISTYIPPSFYEVYYLYLYIGSMIFLFFMYATLLWGRPKIPVNTLASPTKSAVKTRSTSGSDSMDESDTDSSSSQNKHIPPVIPSARRPSLLSPLGRQHHYGSFYLRMGAVAFGIGSMIYSGLEFGQYFELNPDTKCHNVLLALTPATRMAFIFIQMYFIFLNNEQIKVYRYKIIARFGLMHMIGTNLAVWLNVLIQETKHEILTFYNPENRTLRISHRIPGHSRGHAVIAPDPTAHLRVPRGLKGPYQIFECRRTNILGTLVQDASPFLFPCTIEYSLICAAILYVMWRSISRPQTPTPQRPDTISSPMKRSPHHYSVDCARAHKGLFVGILLLVLTIISLILFFVLISRPDFVSLAVTEVTICELLIYGTATIATLVGMIQIRHLQYDAYRSFSLDDILLVGAQTGSFLYNIFTVIAGHFTLRSNDMLVPINALASIVQTACQTMFILDASRRQAVSPSHLRKKPGREIVTFMLVVNLAMWAISTLEKSRAESHPIQLNFYGLWAWTIITHVSMPLAIFYRFHSTVCLCEIWKRAYKLKPTYM